MRSLLSLRRRRPPSAWAPGASDHQPWLYRIRYLRCLLGRVRGAWGRTSFLIYLFKPVHRHHAAMRVYLKPFGWRDRCLVCLRSHRTFDRPADHVALQAASLHHQIKIALRHKTAYKKRLTASRFLIHNSVLVIRSPHDSHTDRIWTGMHTDGRTNLEYLYLVDSQTFFYQVF